MATKTKNYGFDKPELNDFADVTVLGETIDKIDTALKNVEEKANDVQALENHINDKNNPHEVTAEQVGARPDTWLPTASEIGAATSETVRNHIKNWRNPHKVTAAQVGAVKTDLSNFDATLVSGCYIKQDETGTLYRIGLDSGGLYVVKQN